MAKKYFKQNSSLKEKMHLLNLINSTALFKAWSLIIKIFLLLKGIKIGNNFYIEGVPKVTNQDGLGRITIGDNVRIMGAIELRVRESGKIIIGDNAKIDRDCRIIAARNATVNISSNTKIGCFTIMNCGADVCIGEYSLISGFCYIQSSAHQICKNEKIQLQKHVHSKILIEQDVWIGSHATILGGVRLKKGSVVGATAVMNKSTKKYEIWAGVPGKRIGSRKK